MQLFKNPKELISQFKKNKEKDDLYLVQPFLQNISTDGDRRVFFIQGEVYFHFVRLPQSGSIISNTAQGGKTILKEMNQEQQFLCKNIGNFLKKHQIFFAGLDLIGNKVGEINITSPTGIRAYETLTQKKMKFSFERYFS